MRSLALACLLLIVGCRPGPTTPAPTQHGSGECQAIIELGESGGIPFLASSITFYYF